MGFAPIALSVDLYAEPLLQKSLQISTGVPLFMVGRDRLALSGCYPGQVYRGRPGFDADYKAPGACRNGSQLR